MKTLILLVAALALLPSTSLSKDAFVEIKYLDQGQTKKSRAKFKFIKNSEKAHVLFTLTSILINSDSTVASVSGENIYFSKKWQKKPGRLLIALGAMNNSLVVTMEDGEDFSLEANVKLKKSVLFNSKCKKSTLSLIEKNISAAPIFIGVKCELTKNKKLVHVSVPAEVELDSSNAFELSGKGERWKSYDIKQIASGKNSTAHFSYSWDGKSFSFKLKSKLGSGEKTTIVIQKEESFVKFHLGLGGAQIAYTTPTNTNSSFSPLLYANIVTKPYLWNLVGNIDLAFGMPLSGLQFYNFNFGTGPRFNFGRSSAALFFEYLALGEDETETTTALTHSQMGVGLDLKISVGSRSLLGIYANYSGVGGSSTHIGARLSLQITTTSKSIWGGFIGMGMQTVTSEITNNESEFSQMMGAVTYGF